MKLKYRTIFISDTHLGSKGTRAAELSQFLKHVRCEKLYLVGDIIDMWRLKSRWYWPKKHNDVVRRILKHAKRKKTQVIYIPGNHDDGARQFVSLNFGGIDIKMHDVHETIDGRKLLITHGDQFDLVVKHSPLLSALGGMAYEWLLRVNRWYNWGRERMGLPYASLSQAIKAKVKSACTFISNFEEALSHEARKYKLDGVVCGHIHKAEIRQEEGQVQYFNCGDWVESCTALAETFDGTIELLDGLQVIERIRAMNQLEEGVADDADDLEGDELALGIPGRLDPAMLTRQDAPLPMPAGR